MWVVRLSGYIAAEKVAIARTYLEKTTKVGWQWHTRWRTLVVQDCKL